MAKEKKTDLTPEPKPVANKPERNRTKAPEEPTINIGALEPKKPTLNPANPVINGKRRKTTTGPDDKLTVPPPRSGTSSGKSKSGASPVIRRGGLGVTPPATPPGQSSGEGFHHTDKLPALSPNARQEIYGILLLVSAMIFFFGLLATNGVVAQVGLFVKRIFGIGAFLIPVLIFVIGLTFFWEGLTKQERFNQTKISAGLLMIVAFICLLHLFAANPKEVAERGEGGGYLAYYLNAFLSGTVTPLGTVLLLVALFVVGGIVAFDVSLRELAQQLRHRYRNRHSSAMIAPVEPAEFEDFDPEEDYQLAGYKSKPQPTLPNYQTDDELLDEMLLGGNSSKTEPLPTIPIPNKKEPATPKQMNIVGKPVQPEPVLNQPKRPLQQNWKRDEEPVQPTALSHKEWHLPVINILASFTDVEVNPNELRKKARLIEDTLASFGVSAFVREVNTGPTVTQFALEPDVGVKVARIVALQNDLALALAAPAIRIEAPVPGQSRVGVEVPNAKVATVGLRELLESDEFLRKQGKLKIALGRDVAGQPIIPDLAKMPHLLIAGSTGSGKSVCINTIIASFLFHYRPDQLQFIMIDPKMVELSTYNGIPHLRFPVVTQIEADPEEERRRSNQDRVPTVMSVLKWATREMERRYKHLSLTGHRNLDSYNKVAGNDNDWEKMSYLVVIIDELADLMMVAPEEAESSICRLAQKARAVGIHLILATQRPSVDVVTGLIKANFPSRITFAVTSQIDSRVILDTGGAEKLLGRGDMLYLPGDAAKPSRVQGTYVSDEEIDTLVQFWRSQNDFFTKSKENFSQPELWPQELREIEAERENGDDEPDELFEAALEIVREARSASVSLLQRRLRVGYNRAAHLIKELEQAGVIGKGDGGRPRSVLMEEEDLGRTTSLTSAASLPLELTPGQRREREVALNANHPPTENEDDDPPL